MAGEPRYDASYHGLLADGRRTSAARILPIILDAISVRSIIDIGCGEAEWLAVARELGVERVFGVDGPWIDPARLHIPADCFLSADLECPLRIEERFDLALCLEVAEHLDAGAADVLIDGLVALAPIILFSAATPGQGGEGHVNEQWQGWWAERFDHRGYRCLDMIRGRIWTARDVEPWYRQNCLVFATTEVEICDRGGMRPPLDIVHPELFAAKERWLRDAERERRAAEARNVELAAWNERAVEAVRRDVSEARAAEAAARAALESMRRSRSWRLTAPLRVFARLLSGHSSG